MNPSEEAVHRRIRRAKLRIKIGVFFYSLVLIVPVRNAFMNEGALDRVWLPIDRHPPSGYVQP